MTVLDRVWLMPVVELRAHALAYGLTGPRELTALVEAVAREVERDEERADVRQRRSCVEARRT